MKQTLKRIVAITLLLTMLLTLFGCKKEEPKDGIEDETTTEAVVYSSANPLTGEKEFNKDYVGKRPVGITIQNSENRCRPQWGLSEPDVVIEGEVEGTATKYLWLYADHTKITKAGPFRSVRRDFVELAEGFDAILVHNGWSAGSSIGAREYLNKTGYEHINGQDGNPATWFKDSVAPNGRGAGQEYRAYTTGESILNAISVKKIRTDISDDYAKPFSFYDTATALDGGACTSIAFRVGNNNAKFTWKDGAYYGSYFGTDMKDNNGTAYSVSNVIILYLNSIKTVDKKGRIDMDLSSGTGVLASNGTYQEITWKKGNGADMIKLLDKNGENEIKLNVGKSYIGLCRLSNSGKTVIEG